MLRSPAISLAVLLLTACGAKVPVFPPQGTIALPAAAHGLDDMAYSGELQRFIIPGGQSGDIYLIDPGSGKITATVRVAAGGKGKGVTTAAYGLGFLFAGDRTHRALVVIDADSHQVVGRRKLASTPDIVRFAASQKEVWVTEPGAGQIEIFRVHPSARPILAKRATIAVPGGPESLAIDDQRDMAYTNLTTDKTVAIDLLQERILERWPNTCKQARGLALAPARGLLFVGCHGGKVVSLDAAHRGTLIASVKVGQGIDLIAYDAVDNRLYIPAADSRMLTLLGIAPSGRMQVLAKYRTAPGAHCVVSDGSGQAYVCDPARGRLLVIRHPAGG